MSPCHGQRRKINSNLFARRPILQILANTTVIKYQDQAPTMLELISLVQKSKRNGSQIHPFNLKIPFLPKMEITIPAHLPTIHLEGLSCIGIQVIKLYRKNLQKQIEILLNKISSQVLVLILLLVSGLENHPQRKIRLTFLVFYLKDHHKEFTIDTLYTLSIYILLK